MQQRDRSCERGVGPAITAALPAESSREANALERMVNEATLEELDGLARPDLRAAQSIVAGRPIATLAVLDALPNVGPTALPARTSARRPAKTGERGARWRPR